jgi:hypothetical protein
MLDRLSAQPVTPVDLRAAARELKVWMVATMMAVAGVAIAAAKLTRCHFGVSQHRFSTMSSNRHTTPSTWKRVAAQRKGTHDANECGT